MEEHVFDMNMWKQIGQRKDARAFMEALESHAESGSTPCQEFVVQWNLMAYEGSSRPEAGKQLLRNAIKFGQLAAESGVPSEAENLPISMMKLTGILTEESNGLFTEEIEDLYKETYKWSLTNADNVHLSAEARKISAQTAKELYEAMPELYTTK